MRVQGNHIAIWQLIVLAVGSPVGVTRTFAQDPGASFEGLGFLPGNDLSWSFARGISDDGLVVVGLASDSDGLSTAIRWTRTSGMVGLDRLHGGLDRDEAYGTNADGSVVVGRGSSENSGEFNEALRWTEERGTVGLGDLPNGVFNSIANSVSADGQVVVGQALTEVVFRQDLSGFFNEAFLRTETAGMVGLGFLAEGGIQSWAHDVSADGTIVVGWADSDVGGDQPFRWTQSDGMVGLGNLGGRSRGEAIAVSADGATIVGYTSSSDFDREAFQWTQSEGMAGLGVLSGSANSTSIANGVAGDGSVVVGSNNSSEAGEEAFVWNTCDGMMALQELLTEEFGLDLAGWQLRAATDISADGLTIVGEGTNPIGEEEAWIAALPATFIKTCAIEEPPSESGGDDSSIDDQTNTTSEDQADAINEIQTTPPSTGCGSLGMLTVAMMMAGLFSLKSNH